MDLKVEKEGSTTITLEAWSSQKEFEQIEENAIRNINSNFNLPGFRKGKISPITVKEKFEKELSEEIIKDFSIRVYSDYIQQNEYELIDEPRSLEGKIEDKKIFVKLSIDIFPDIELPEYNDIKVENKEIKITEEEMNEELKYIVNKHAMVKPSINKEIPAKKGDIVIIDYESFLDGKPIESFSAKNYELKLGDNIFSEEFDINIEGHKIGESFEINDIEIPNEHSIKEIYNKKISFNVCLNEIKNIILPSIDDELAKMENFENLEKLEKNLEQKLILRRQQEKDDEIFEEILDVFNSKISLDINGNLLEREIQNKIQELNYELSKRDITLKEYLEIKNIDEDEFKSSLNYQIEKELRKILIIKALIKKENIEVDHEKRDEHFQKVLKYNNIGKKNNQEYYRILSQIESNLKIEKLKELLLEKIINN